MPTLTLDEFLPKARELNPDYSDDELIQAYQDRYSTPPTQTVSSAPLMTLDEFLPKARKLNPDYSDDELTAAWQEKYGARGAKEKDPGFSGTLLEGAKSAGRSLKAAAQTATGNLSGVEETARVETEKDPALQKLLADIQVRKNALGKDPSWWQSAKAVGGAVVDNPKGAAMLATEQLPNSALALGSAGVGALAGSALGPAGTVIGGIAGLFVGNTAIETGAKAMEKAVDGFTPEERTETLKEGAIKGGVVTGFDAATFGLTKWLTGTVARAMERATINVLQREGIDTTNKAAVQAARQNPEIVAKVQQAQDTARAATNTLGKKLARGSGEVGSEAIGEGAGEYIGEVAATGKGDKVEAVIEALSGLGQSGAEIAIAQGMSRKQRQQGAFGDVTGQPVVTERTPDEMGMGQTAASPQPASPSPATSTPIQASAQPDLFSQPAQSGMSEPPGVPPLPNIRPVTDAKTLDEAIAGSQQIVKDATDKAKAQAIPDTSTQSITPNVINIGRMGEAISGNLYEALWKKVQAGDTKENGQESVYLQAAKPVYQAGGLKDVHDLKAFSHEISNIEDSGIRGNERNTAIRSVIQRWAQKEQLRLAQQNPVSEPVQPVPAVQPTDEGPLPSQADLAYPSSKQVRDLIHEKGLHLDTPVFREYLKQAVGKEKFADLTPQELQTLAEKVQKIKAPQQPTPIQEAPPQVPLTPAERPEKPYAPTTTIPEAQVPRSELTPEKNAEILLRAERPQGVTQATENAEVFQNVPKKRGANENLREVPTESGQADQENPRLVLPAMPRKGDSGVQENPQADTRTANEIKRQELRARLQEQGENNQKAVPEVRIGEGRNAPRGLQQANASGVDVQAVPPGDAQPSKVVKVPTSRTERLKQQKQKMEGKRPLNALELVDRMYREVMDNTKVVHSMQRERKDQWATVKRIDAAMNNSLREGLDYGEAAARVSPEDLQALSALLSPVVTPSAPTEATFSLTAPEQTKVKAKETGPEQLSIDVPPPTVGEKPIIGREATLEEAPLFSKNAQTPDAEQTTLDTPTAQKEPWEMTRREFVDAVRGGLDFPQLGMSPTPLRVMREAGSFENLDRQAKERHIAEVAEAFYEGKPVPSKVLADYPDLQAKEAESQPETAQSPTDILAAALRQAADQIQGKPAAPSAIDTIEAYEAFSKRLRNGEVTLDEYKQAFQQVKDNKEALVGELKKLTKDQLVKRSRSLRSSKNDSKDELVRQSYDGMLSTFSTGRGVSYVLSGKGGYEQALAKMVEDTTEADLKKYADDIAETTAEYKKRLEGFENPQTLQNFDDRVRVKGEASLTPEQLARYDELLAEAGRAKRKQAQEQKATVQGVEAGTDLQMVESKHTKTGDKLWVVKLANRVDRSVYDRLNQAAHKLGGRYSSYNKDGAIPGFTFRSEEAAKAFMAAGKGETVSAAPVREAAKATVQNNAVSKLREMADNLQEKADESLNADRKTNTAKRARQASSAENDALASKALAETMRNLADAIESGEATHLSGLRTKAQVEMLDSMLERAKHDRIKQETKGSYVDYERQKHRKAEPEDAAFAKLPDFNTTDDQLTHVVKDLADVKGTERIRMKVSKLIERAKGSNFVPVDRELVEAALEKYPQFRRGVTPPWHWPETLAKLKRLESMGITSLPELRAALREFVEYRGKRGTIDKAKQLERELIGNKGIGNDFFPTPKETAQRMVAEAGIEPGMTVLEPSAGNGNIAEAIRAAGVNPDVVEQSSKLREILEAKGFNLAGRDFMDVTDGQYDRIVMNPPFSNGQDAEHIRHAYELLKPGGKLVAIAGEGIFFRNDAKATAFREWLDEHGGTSEKLPEGTFKDSSLMATTGVNARMVIVEKPGESAPEETQPEAVGSAFSRLMADERGSIPASLFGRDKNATGTIDPPIARERLKESKASLRPYLLGALGLEQLSQVYGKDHAEVKAYNKATQDMEADFTEMSRESDVVARAWTDLKIPVADKMAQVMEDARFLNFDPDPRKKQEADSVKKQELVTRFDQLPEEAKAVYRQARDFYTGLSKKRFEALRDRILREHGTQKDIDELNVAYTAERRKIYFPFTRFGDYIVKALKVENGVTKDRDVQAFESPAEANKFAQLMKLKGWTVKQTVASEYSREHDGGASQVVDKMKEIIERLDKSPGLPGISSKDTLLDALNQSYLQSMPDLSYSKHYIHARDVKGASRDALRAFAHSALHGSHHISRLRHADKVTKSLFEMDERIKEAREGDVQEARQVYNELVRRHNDIMNPNTHPVSAWLGQLGFTMSLGGVVATGITNATQVPLVTYPWLGARYGFGKASAALARAYKDFLNPRTLNKDSLFDASKSKLISESERKMLMELARRGRIDLTQTMDLAGLSAQDNLSRKAKLTGTLNEKVTRMLGFTFHAPEVMNRQVTALSTFRLEKEKGGSFDEALQRAEQAIIDTHFLYQSFNRPRYMSGNFLRVLTQFKQYSQNIAYTYGRAASIWMDRNGATKEERQVAKRQLISMLALQFGAAGALGMPFFGSGVDILMAVVGAFGDDDDKREWEVALRKWLDGTATSLAEAFTDDKEQAAKVGKELAEVVSHGASRLTPWDMAGRLGQNDLFFREPQREREGRQAVMDWMLALGGPVPSYGVNFMLGMGDVAKGITELNAGFFMRGVEELTPAVLRNGVKSLRYTLEGVRTRDEYKQLELDTSEKLGQAFGFTPARVAEMYESTTAVKNKEHRILNEQKSLKNRFARAVDDQDDAAKQRILEDIRGFNERNRMFAITSDTLNRSLKARRQHEAGMERGMYLPPRRRALLEEGDFGDF